MREKGGKEGKNPKQINPLLLRMEQQTDNRGKTWFQQRQDLTPSSDLSVLKLWYPIKTPQSKDTVKLSCYLQEELGKIHLSERTNVSTVNSVIYGPFGEHWLNFSYFNFSEIKLKCLFPILEESLVLSVDLQIHSSSLKVSNTFLWFLLFLLFCFLIYSVFPPWSGTSYFYLFNNSY